MHASYFCTQCKQGESNNYPPPYSAINPDENVQVSIRQRLAIISSVHR